MNDPGLIIVEMPVNKLLITMAAPMVLSMLMGIAEKKELIKMD